MVKSSSSLILFSVVSAHGDAEAMLQVGTLNSIDQAHENRYNQALDMEARFQKLASDAARSGGTPSLPAAALEAVMEALAVLETEINQEKTANDLSWSQAIQALKQCDELMNLAFEKPGGVNEYNQTMTDARDTHASCRGDEDIRRGDEKIACEAQDELAEDANTSPLKTTNNYNCDHARPGAPVGDVKAFKKYLEAITNWGEEFNDPLALKMENCKTNATAADISAQKCDKDQTGFEVDFCEYEVILSATCAAHTECYDAQGLNLMKVKAEVQAKEKSEKVMWKSTQKVRCFLGMLDSEAVSQNGYDECMRMLVDTRHLNIEFDIDHTRATCDMKPVKEKPGDDAWKMVEYDALAPQRSWKTVSPWARGLEPVTSCLSALKPPRNFDLLECETAKLKYPGFHAAVAVSKEGAAEACSQTCKSKGSSSFVLAYDNESSRNCFCSDATASLLELEGRPKRGPPALLPGADGCTPSECFDGKMKSGTSCTAKFIVEPKCKLSPTWNAQGEDGEANIRTYTICLRRENEDGLQFVRSDKLTCDNFPFDCLDNPKNAETNADFTDLCQKFCNMDM